MIIGALRGKPSYGSVGTNILRNGVTGRSTPASLATPAAQAPAAFTTVLVATSPRVVLIPATFSPAFSIAVTSAERQISAPCSAAQAVKPVMALYGSTNPSVPQKLPPSTSSDLSAGKHS